MEVNKRTELKISSLLLESSVYKEEEFSDGIFVQVTLDKDELSKVWKVLKEAGFKNLLKLNKAHVTLIYSTRKPNKDFSLTDIEGSVKPQKFEIFGGNGDNPYALVLKLNAPCLVKKHNEYMKKYNLKFDFDEYQPHVTVCYDILECAGIEIEDKKAIDILKTSLNSLIPKMPKEIKIDVQTFTPLNKNWVKDAT